MLYTGWNRRLAIAVIGLGICGAVAGTEELPVNRAVRQGLLNESGKNAKGFRVLDMWRCPMPDPAKPGAGYPAVPEVRHQVIYRGDRDNGAYNHHSNLFWFDNRFYAMWSNHRYGEDGPGQRVLYATSADGVNWSAAEELFPSPVEMTRQKSAGSYLAAGELFVWDGRLFGRASGHEIDYWENKERTSRSHAYDSTHIYPHYVHYNSICREIKPDGTLGKIFVYGRNPPPADYPISAQNEVEPRVRTPGRMSCRAQGVDTSRLCEPAFFRTSDNQYGVLLRDDHFSHRKYVSYSGDGINWPAAEPTNIPDSPSMTVALSGNDGSVLFIGNHMAPAFDVPTPRHYGRDPLMITYSPDGYRLVRSYAVKSGPHSYTVPQNEVFGRGGAAQYPAALVRDGKVYVMYSSGKEDIMISVFPLSAIDVSEQVRYTDIR